MYLLEEIVEVEFVLPYLLVELLGLLRSYISWTFGKLHYVAHAEDAVGHPRG